MPNRVRSNLLGPHVVNLDVALQMSFTIHESQQLEFRSKFFNIFNHPNFGLPAVNPDVRDGSDYVSALQ